VAYMGCREGKWHVFLDGVAGPAYDGLGTASTTFGPGGARVAYAAKRGGVWFTVVGGAEGRAYDAILGRGPTVAFSPDGRHFAYSARRASQCFAVLDGVEGSGYDRLITAPPVFDASGGVEYLAIRAGTLYRVTHTLANG